MMNMKKAAYRQQAGLTLIELMIAMTLGLLLLAGILGIFMSNNKSAKFTKEQAAIQQDGRFAMDYVRKFMHNGGLDNWFAPLNTRSRFGAEVSLLTRTEDGGVKPSADDGNYDRLVIEYEVTPSMENLYSCNGADLKNYKNMSIREVFSVQNKEFGCESMYSNANSKSYKPVKALINGNQQEIKFVPLIGGVEAFQVVYGINRTNDLYIDPSSAEYLNATSVKQLLGKYSQSDISKRIMSIKYALLISSDSGVDNVNRVSNMRFNVLDQEVVVTGEMPNLYTSTFKVRNGG